MSVSIYSQTDVCKRIEMGFRPAENWEQWFLLSSDRHIDNEKSDLSLQRHHLDQAVARGAYVLDFGDLFDAMQGKGDRRSSKGNLRNETKRSDYLNSLVDYAVNFFKPYAKNIAIIAEGNHETGIEKHAEYNLTSGLVYALKNHGSPVIHAGYRGWICISFRKYGNRSIVQKRIYFHHGSGGGGMMSFGTLDVRRKASDLQNADFVIGGHIHEQWVMPLTQVRIANNGQEVISTQYHVRIPTYKDEYSNQSGGFHHEKGGPPKPIGGYWIRFYYSHRTGTVEASILEADK